MKCIKQSLGLDKSLMKISCLCCVVTVIIFAQKEVKCFCYEVIVIINDLSGAVKSVTTVL